MIQRTLLFLFAIGLPLLAASQPVTQTAVFPSSPSQANTPGAALHLSGVFRSPGEAPAPVPAILGPGSPSTTVCYTSFGSTTFPAPGQWSLAGSVHGAAGAPFAIAAGIQPGSSFCGGFAGWPCMTGPLLLGSQATPMGILHLGPAPIMLLDGIWGLAPPAFLDPAGTVSLAAAGVIDTVTNGGVEMSFSIQAAVTDPASPSGISLTAAATVSQWIFWL